MARPVLTRLLAALALAFLLAPAARAQSLCPANTAPGAAATLDMAKQSPLYRLATSRLGSATACRLTKDGTEETLVMSFPGAAALTLTSNPDIELASQSLALGGATLTRAQALDSLRQTETASIGAKGCGIPWSRRRAAALAGHGDLELDGTVCNCKATLEGTDKAITKLGFSSAC